MENIAFAWASGLIEFGETLPDGALPIAVAVDDAQARKMRDSIEILARHGKGVSKGKLLVPGIPEASNQQAAMKALTRFNKVILADMNDQPRVWEE
jgi:hypothetical protein